MPASGIAVVPLRLRSQFLDGLTPTDRDTILAAATLRRFAANLVITNQGNPADHFFLLTKGLARFFFVTEEGEKSFSGLGQEIYSVLAPFCRTPLLILISSAQKR
jgi:CRP-like cAMP-binding protein